MDMDVLLLSSVSCSNLFFVTCMADLTGMDVNRAETSSEMMHSPLSSLFFLMSSVNSLELLTWWIVLEVTGFRILANSLATTYVTEPLLETMGLRGLFFLYILGSPNSMFIDDFTNFMSDIQQRGMKNYKLGNFNFQVSNAEDQDTQVFEDTPKAMGLL